MGASVGGLLGMKREQIDMQLKRIVESDLFAGGGGHKKNERLAQLLTHIVAKTLGNEPVSEIHLLVDFFKLTPDEVGPDQGIARRTIGRLRDKLRDYYATVGLYDPLTIEIPLGQYNAKWKPNPQSPARKEVVLGFHHVDREAPDHLRQALIHFERAIELEPDYSEGYAGKASALLTLTLHAYGDNPREYFHQAENAARRATELDSASWRGFANLGVVHLFRHEWELSDAAFNEAKRLSPFEIDGIGGYGPYLLSRGHYADALKLADRYRESGYDKPVAGARRVVFVHAAALPGSK
jgi:tetratricopeptide (TPR) repeat protein